MLIINLLSNYLPEPESPEYQSRLELLPAYRDSLHVRYPPVCESCLPQVEEEIRKKDQMARVKALGGYLSKGKDRRRRVSGGLDTEPDKSTTSETLLWWKWCVYLSMAACAQQLMSDVFEAAYDYHPFSLFSFSHPILPLLVGISLLWTAWDPTYATFRKARQQGRDVRIQGKRAYNMLQILAWTIRMCSSIILTARWFQRHIVPPDMYRLYLLTAFSSEIITVATAYHFLRLQQPPSIRLVDTHAHVADMSRSGTPVPDSRGTTPMSATSAKFPPTIEPDALLSLSLSSKPVLPKSKPVFGLPSLHGSTSTLVGFPTKEEPADDEMDWTPTNPDPSAFNNDKRPATSETENHSWLRPQRFFAPEKPTGLEGLFESTRIQDEPMPLQSDTRWSDMSLVRVFTITCGGGHLCTH
ncbi:hypothetical protein CPB84DRAFT_1841443 [Gymnopilus junonius]|uniref:Ima1 N-terminal domain-containing protein n=1 Tax=Gymnopilus junonius TaxID=109634 RepID=A0A9P5TUC8_GYMJU|nr:hypothetical protein CPB84DRAFT_1841443 [Gymnopilus junonius]